MPTVINEIITTLTSGIEGVATGIGSGLGQLVENIFLKMNGSEVVGLSTFGGVVVIFAGVGLAIGLSKLVVHWITGLGGSGM